MEWVQNKSLFWISLAAAFAPTTLYFVWLLITKDETMMKRDVEWAAAWGLVLPSVFVFSIVVVGLSYLAASLLRSSAWWLLILPAAIGLYCVRFSVGFAICLFLTMVPTMFFGIVLCLRRIDF